MAISLDNSAKQTITAASSATFSHTIGSGSNRFLGVWVRSDGTASPTGVTYNSVAMTKLYENTTGTMRLSYWYLLNSSLPSAGAYNIVVSWAANKDAAILSASFSGVNQAAPGYTTSTATNSNYTVTRSFINNNSYALMHVSIEEDAPITPGSGQTEIQDSAIGDESNYELVNSGSNTQTATSSTSLYRALLLELAPATSSPQTVTPTGISSSESFGTNSIQRGNVNVSPSGIASAQAFGTVLIVRILKPTGISSAQAIGTAKINRNILVSGIASAQAFGTAKVNRSISVSGLITKEGFGFLTVLRGIRYLSVVPGIASANAFGTVSVLRGNKNLSPTGIVSANAFGTAKINRNIKTTGFINGNTFGTSALKTSYTFAPTGIASSESFGSVSIQIGSSNVQPTGIASENTFGTSKINRNIKATGIVSANAFGTSVLYKNKNVFPNGIISSNAFGTAKVNKELLVFGIASQESVSSPEVINQVVVIPFGITSDEAFGTLELDILFRADSILSAETFGSPTIVRYIVPSGINSGENIGIPEFYPVNTLVPDSISTLEQFGQILFKLIIEDVGGISSEESFGNIICFYSINTFGIASEESFGSVNVKATKKLIPTGITSKQAFGVAKLHRNLTTNSVLSTETFGTPDIKPTNGIIISGISSEESFGSLVLNRTIFATGFINQSIISSPSIVLGGVNLSPGGIDSLQGFGSLEITVGSTFLLPSGIPSSETLGSFSVTAGNVSLLPESISSGESFGSFDTYLNTNIKTYSIFSGENFGYATFTDGRLLYPTGLSSKEAFGAINITWNQSIYDIEGINSEEIFGSFKVIVQIGNKFTKLFEQDLDKIFFNPKEFSESITFFASPAFTVNGIFDNEYISVNPGSNIDIQSSSPAVWVPSKAFTKKPDRGMIAVVRGVRYRVMTAEADGTGLTVMRLNHE